MFTRVDTKIVKGLTIILMLAHHLFLFQDRQPAGFGFQDLIMTDAVLLSTVVGQFGKLCVSIFLFLGGYGLWCRKDKSGVMKDSIIKLYKAYWKVFIIFVPIGFFLFSNQIVFCEDEAVYGAFSDFSWKHFWANFIGWEHEYNQEWWFLKTYLCMLFLGWIYIRSVRKIGFWRECMLVILSVILFESVFPGLATVNGLTGLQDSLWYNELFYTDAVCSSFFMGIVFARYDGISRLREILSPLRTWARKLLAFSMILLMGYARYYFLSTTLDVFLAPCLTALFLELLDGIGVLRKIFEILGKHSTNMWLTHTFFCYYFYPFVQLTHISKNPWIDLGILTTLSLGASILLEGFYKLVWKVTEPVLTLKK